MLLEIQLEILLYKAIEEIQRDHLNIEVREDQQNKVVEEPVVEVQM